MKKDMDRTSADISGAVYDVHEQHSQITAISACYTTNESMMKGITTMKKLFAVLATLFLMFAFAALAEESGDFGYSILENGNARIDYYDGSAKALEIPAALDGHKVTAIGYGAISGSDVISVTIPYGVTTIGEQAFAYCDKLKSVTIPDSVTNIGYWAFFECNSLESIAIPGSVTSMGENPFVGCKKLKRIDVSPTNKYFTVIDGALFSKPDQCLLCYPIGLSKTEYSIPKGTRRIGESAFLYCDNLKSVTIPDSVTSIGYWAFHFCDKLESVTIPNSVRLIEYEAFSYCPSLKSVTIPDSVTSIGFCAFYSCDSLTSITIPDSVTSIGDEAFSWCSDRLVITVKKGSYAADYCKANGYAYKYAK